MARSNPRGSPPPKIQEVPTRPPTPEEVNRRPARRRRRLRAKAKARPAKIELGRGRKRRVSVRAAWLQVHAVGRMVNKEDHVKFKRAIQAPGGQEHFARTADALSRSGKQKRAPATHLAELRRRRENMKRTKATWDPIKERQNIEREQATDLGRSVGRAKAATRAATQFNKERTQSQFQFLTEFAKGAQTNGFSAKHKGELVPHPTPGAAHSRSIKSSVWQAPSRSAVMEALPALMQKALEHTTQWEQQHATITGVDSIPSESKAARWRRVCRDALMCVC